MESIMSDFKSKLPSLQEITNMAGKLFKDLRTSVSEIIDDYKQKHTEVNNHTADDVVSSTNASNSTPNHSHTQTKPSSTASAPIPPVTPVDTQTVHVVNDTTPIGSAASSSLKTEDSLKATEIPIQSHTTQPEPLPTQDLDQTTANLGKKKPKIEKENQIDEQKPLKDDLL